METLDSRNIDVDKVTADAYKNETNINIDLSNDTEERAFQATKSAVKNLAENLEQGDLFYVASIKNRGAFHQVANLDHDKALLIVAMLSEDFDLDPFSIILAKKALAEAKKKHE